MPPPDPTDRIDITLAPSPGEHGRLALTVMWCSFLSASVATMVFFAFVDPGLFVAMLKSTTVIPGRTGLYSLGFFFFWAICASASWLTACLLRPTRRPS
jgi:hypothetical protein